MSSASASMMPHNKLGTKQAEPKLCFVRNIEKYKNLEIIMKVSPQYNTTKVESEAYHPKNNLSREYYVDTTRVKTVIRLPKAHSTYLLEQSITPPPHNPWRNQQTNNK